MGTYDHKQVLLDYANDRITVEMAVGHGLQHIDKLYEAQGAININQHQLQNEINTQRVKIDNLEATLTKLQVVLDTVIVQLGSEFGSRRRTDN